MFEQKHKKIYLFTTAYNWSEKQRVDCTAGGSNGRGKFFDCIDL